MANVWGLKEDLNKQSSRRTGKEQFQEFQSGSHRWKKNDSAPATSVSLSTADWTPRRESDGPNPGHVLATPWTRELRAKEYLDQ